ncbi:hypothetical protein MA16_Dca026342 [Dendrobium catenatum]|uniref:Uncharacterized protein n=1 Tax=Dendrobium catenatum TaxID=906689 RepID=A0A2I0X1I9_9ASPA|nr:hypothetical protein MA16_Dca026342 [Dendrobium catenatum]
MHHLFYGRIKCDIFENLSITTKIKSSLSLVLGKPRTKSIVILIHGLVGIYKGVYEPCDCFRYFTCLQVIHLLQTLSIFNDVGPNELML